MIRSFRSRLLALALTLPALATAAPSADERPAPVLFADCPAVAELDLSDTTLEKAIDRLRTLTGANIVVRWNALHSAAVDRR